MQKWGDKHKASLEQHIPPPLRWPEWLDQNHITTKSKPHHNYADVIQLLHHYHEDHWPNNHNHNGILLLRTGANTDWCCYPIMSCNMCLLQSINSKFHQCTAEHKSQETIITFTDTDNISIWCALSPYCNTPLFHICANSCVRVDNQSGKILDYLISDFLFWPWSLPWHNNLLK